jgi:hypothetical protein
MEVLAVAVTTVPPAVVTAVALLTGVPSLVVTVPRGVGEKLVEQSAVWQGLKSP